MKKVFFFAAAAVLVSCNNSKKEKSATSADTATNSPAQANEVAADIPAVGTSIVNYTIADTAHTVTGSVLVSKDKDKLSPGNDHLAIVTANSSNGESFVLNFVFATKPGVYPVVGLAFTRGNHVFGGILGGKPKLTNYKVNLTQCDDLGSNGYGGNKWRISGSVDEEVTIDAMGIMKMDGTHPDNIKISKIGFSNLTFDDNMDKLMEEGLKRLK